MQATLETAVVSLAVPRRISATVINHAGEAWRCSRRGHWFLGGKDALPALGEHCLSVFDRMFSLFVVSHSGLASCKQSL